MRYMLCFAIAIACAGMGCAMEEHEHEHEHIHVHPVAERGFIDDGWVRLETGIIPEGYIPVDIRDDGVVVSHLTNGSLQRLILSSPNGHYCIRRYVEDPATGGVLNWTGELDCYTVAELAATFSLRLP